MMTHITHIVGPDGRTTLCGQPTEPWRFGPKKVCPNCVAATKQSA